MQEGHPRIRIFNENYFEKIDTQDKAYWLGFLYADGSIDKKGYSVTLGLQTRDKYIIEQFVGSLEHKNPKYHERKGNINSFSICLCSKKLANDLMKLGCVNNKSLILNSLPILPDSMDRHFIRGYFDGDGSVSERNGLPLVNFMGTKKFMLNIMNILENNGVFTRIPKLTIPSPPCPIHRFVITDLLGCRRLFDYLYKESIICLLRKKQKLENLLEINKNANAFRDGRRISRCRGVCFDKSRNKWILRTKRKYIGRFNTEKQAILAKEKIYEKSM